MAVALILLLIAIGSVLFHLFSPWWWTPIATNWGYIDDTINITFWITGFVFTAVILFMAYCVFRFHHKEGRQAAYNPENKKLEWWLSVGTGVGVAAMLAPGRGRLAPVRDRSGRCHRGRDHGPAMAVELPLAGEGWPVGHVRCPQHQS
ncbi:heme/copper-type cytochrome/quinol oxidase subunit 2 [Bradyrhizobium diazoefficiens]